jgi:hypothetical protein
MKGHEELVSLSFSFSLSLSLSLSRLNDLSRSTPLGGGWSHSRIYLSPHNTNLATTKATPLREKKKAIMWQAFRMEDVDVAAIPCSR